MAGDHKVISTTVETEAEADIELGGGAAAIRLIEGVPQVGSPQGISEERLDTLLREMAQYSHKIPTQRIRHLRGSRSMRITIEASLAANRRALDEVAV